MALETGTFINSLVATNPAATDALAAADDHLRLIKSTIKNTFPNLTGAANLTQAEANILDGATLDTTELNTLDGITSTTAELNILNGCTVTAANLNVLSGITNVNQITEVSADATPSLGGSLAAGSNDINFTDTGFAFKIVAEGNDLHIYNGTTLIISIESDGTIRTAGDLVAFDSTP